MIFYSILVVIAITLPHPTASSEKVPLLSSIRRPPPASSTSSSSFCQLSTVPLAPPPLIPPGGLVVPGGIPGMPAKYNTQAVQILDFEAKVLYNQSMHAMIAREDAMTTYYRMKARKVELEIKKLERELGEDQDDHQEE
uniref:DUF148 domain-containing protein n=1 Tax=Caenorhabditis tropicalis TaxID=1561998 RepID=A0A1I7UN27_9PELO